MNSKTIDSRSIPLPLQRLWATGIGLAALCLAGCISANTRYAEIGHVSAIAHLDKGSASYREIDIDQPMEASAPRLCLRLPNGRIVTRASFSYEALKKAGFEDIEQKDQTLNYSYALTRYGASFFYFNGDLVSIKLSETKTEPIGVSREGMKQFYTLPLSQDQIERLFGRPEKVSDKYRL